MSPTRPSCFPANTNRHGGAFAAPPLHRVNGRSPRPNERSEGASTTLIPGGTASIKLAICCLVARRPQPIRPTALRPAEERFGRRYPPGPADSHTFAKSSSPTRAFWRPNPPAPGCCFPSSALRPEAHPEPIVPDSECPKPSKYPLSPSKLPGGIKPGNKVTTPRCERPCHPNCRSARRKIVFAPPILGSVKPQMSL
jgi:hypothetical protein